MFSSAMISASIRLASEASREVLRIEAYDREAIPLEHPARPAFVHAGHPAAGTARLRGCLTRAHRPAQRRARACSARSSRARPAPQASGRSPRTPTAGKRDASRPAFQARLIARNALFCAGSSASAGPLPAIFPAAGRWPRRARLASKPTPGTLSNGARVGVAGVIGVRRPAGGRSGRAGPACRAAPA